MTLAEMGFGLNGIGRNGYWPNWELDQVALDEMGLDEVAIPPFGSKVQRVSVRTRNIFGDNYRSVTRYLLLRVNCDKIVHVLWDFDA